MLNSGGEILRRQENQPSLSRLNLRMVEVRRVVQRYDAYVLQKFHDQITYDSIPKSCDALIHSAKKVLPPTYKQ